MTDWCGTRTLKAYGYRLGFRWSDPYYESVLAHLTLPDWVETEEQPDTLFSLSRDPDDPERFIFQHDDKDPVVGIHESQIENHVKREAHLDLATYAPDLVFVHAGVVKVGPGLVVTPGRSYAGKSTMVRHLIKQGGTYYSDEYAVIRSDGMAYPFPRALCQRLTGGKEKHIPATELGWTPDLPAAPVIAIVSGRYRKDANWEPEEMTAGQATLELFANTVSAQITPERAMRFLPQAAQGALCLTGERGEVTEMVPALLERLSQL